MRIARAVLLGVVSRALTSVWAVAISPSLAIYGQILYVTEHCINVEELGRIYRPSAVIVRTCYCINHIRCHTGRML